MVENMEIYRGIPRKGRIEYKIVLPSYEGSWVIKRGAEGELELSPLEENPEIIEYLSSYLSPSNLITFNYVNKDIEGIINIERKGLSARFLDLRKRSELKNIEEIEKRLGVRIVLPRMEERELKKRSNPAIQYGIPVL